MKALKVRHILLCATMLAAMPTQASAVTVFSQGPLLNDGGVRSVFWNADDFTLSSATVLTGATFNLVQDVRQGPNFYTPTINYGLYGDLNGAVGSLLQSGTVTANRTALAIAPYAGISYLQFYSWAFDFKTPLAAIANTRYWIGVQQSDDIALGILQNGANPAASAQIGGSVNGPYSPRGVGLAFSLQGNNATVPGPVPEPATWAMLLFGFGSVGYALRRRPKVAMRVRFA